MIILKHDTPILTIDDWFKLAAPKGKAAQWVDGRSAKECAIAWLATPGAFPPEIASLFAHADFDALRLHRIEPEALLSFDRHSGPRNADVAVWAHDDRGPVAISVEAKADEPFAQPVAEALSAALEMRIATPLSGALPRIIDLAMSLLWPREKGQVVVGEVRYQLLTAVAGTLAMAHAHGARRAVLVVHELVSSRTSQAKLAANAQDLDRFVKRLSRGTVNGVFPGTLYGPFTVPGAPLFANPAALYVGKAVRVVSNSVA